MTRRSSSLFLISAIALAAATAVVLILSVSSLRHTNQLRRVIDRIERLIAGGTREELAEELLNARNYARSASEWRSLLRYAWQSDATPETIYQIAESALARHEKDALFLHMVRYTAIRTQRLERALELRDRDGSSELSQELSVLAALQSRSIIPLETLKPLEALLMKAVDNDPAALLELYTSIPDPRFLENGALLGATIADETIVRSAAEPLRRESLRPDSSEGVKSSMARIITAAWLEDGNWLFTTLRTLPGRDATSYAALMIQGDFFIRQEQIGEAIPVYEEVLATSEDAGIVPYLNLAYLYERTSRKEEALATIRSGLDRYSSDPQLQARFATNLIHTNRSAEAMKFLQDLDFPPILYEENKPEAIHHLWLLAGAINSTPVPIERFESSLWRYVNEHPDADEVASFLASYLRIRNDGEGLAILLDRYAGSLKPWYLAERAVFLTEQNNLAEADQFFRDAVAATKFWEVLYNAALFALQHYPVLDVSSRVDEIYRLAEILSLTDTERAYFVILRAETARLNEDTARAEQLAERAIELNPDEESFRTYRTLLADR